MIREQFIKLILLLSPVVFFSCSKQDAIDLMVDVPELLKKERIASFYGPDAKKMCETYRKIHAGFCDTINQRYVKCFDLNEKKYKTTECE